MQHVLKVILLLPNLTLCTLGKNFSSRHFETFFLFFLGNRRQFVRSYFIGKIRKISRVCRLLNLPIAPLVLTCTIFSHNKRILNTNLCHQIQPTDKSCVSLPGMDVISPITVFTLSSRTPQLLTIYVLKLEPVQFTTQCCV